MSRGAAAFVVAASLLYVALVSGTIRRAGVNYEEVVPYVLTSFDIRDVAPHAAAAGSAPRLVSSPWLPRLAFEPVHDLRLPLLNQLYMTDHLSYGGVALAAAGVDPLWAARGWHALFGLVLLWILFDCARLLGLGERGAALTILLAATSLQVTACYTVARFDESLPSFGTVVVLWAALRHGRDARQRWVWIGVVGAALGITGKVTALWSLAALAAAAALAGWRPPALRALRGPLIAVLALFAPMVGFALAGTSAAGLSTSGEVWRRLAFFSDLFTSDVLTGTVANLIEYLGNWGGIVSKISRGAEARGANQFGRLFATLVLIWLAVRALAPGAVPRRKRLEAQMLAYLAVVFGLVTMFFREHRDYQFLLLIPFHALAMAAFLEWLAARFLDTRLPRWLAGAVVCALPLASNLWDQAGVRVDLSAANNAMLDLGVQRQSARWLLEHGAHRPVVVTFYAVGTYELLTDRVVRPVYTFPMMRASKDGSYVPDFDAIWRSVISGDEDRYVVLPLGENEIESRHFDEATIRESLLRVTSGQRLHVFANADGDPLLEVWRVAAPAAE